jgi:uncharacterized protein HemX
MRCMSFVGAVGLALVSTAWAGSGLAGPAPAGQTAASLPQARQQVARNQAEVKRLEQDVARRESDSKHASERLQQQDQAIAELQKQLQELRAKPAAAQH